MPHSEEINGNSNSVKEEGTVDGGAHAVEPDGQQLRSAVAADGEDVSER